MKIKISIIQPALAKNAIFWPRRPPCNGFNLALLVFANDRKSSIKYQRVLVFVSADDQKSSQKYQRVSVLVSAYDRKSSQKYQRVSVLVSADDRKSSQKYQRVSVLISVDDRKYPQNFRYQIFSIPVLRLFSGTKFFRYRFRDFFPVPNFSDTGSETFFRYQFFSIPVPIPPEKQFPVPVPIQYTS